jgi:hypothetical protein
VSLRGPVEEEKGGWRCPRASVAPGDNGAPAFPTNSDELMVTGDAPEHGRKNSTRERARGHLGAP